MGCSTGSWLLILFYRACQASCEEIQFCARTRLKRSSVVISTKHPRRLKPRIMGDLDGLGEPSPLSKTGKDLLCKQERWDLFGARTGAVLILRKIKLTHCRRVLPALRLLSTVSCLLPYARGWLLRWAERMVSTRRAASTGRPNSAPAVSAVETKSFM